MAEEQRVNGRSVWHEDRDWITPPEASEAFGITGGGLAGWEKNYENFPKRQTEGVTIRKKGDEFVPNVAWNAQELATWHAETLPGRSTGPTTNMPAFRDLGAQFSTTHRYGRRSVRNPPRYMGPTAEEQSWPLDPKGGG